MPLSRGITASRSPRPTVIAWPHADGCELQCLDKTESALKRRPDTAALLAEPIQSVGGVIPPRAWWERLDEMRRRRGLLLILDEIQTGLGRTGKFFAAEHYDLEPDIITVGKGLSGGVGSLSAVLVSDEVGASFRSGTAPTSAGNPVSAAAGTALVDTLLEEGLVEHCAEMGEHLAAAMEELDHPWIGDIRFQGLMGGVELVADRSSREVLPKDRVSAVAKGLRDEGMLLTVSGMYGNVLRIQPPFSITAGEIDALAGALKRVLATVE